MRPPTSSPPCAALPSPLRRCPLAPDLFLSPLCRDLLKPPLRRRYAAPLCATSPRTRGAAAPLRWTLAPLRFARGWPPPLRPQPSRSRGWARPAPGAGHSSPCRHACGVHGWAPGGTRSLTLARLRLAQGARREDRRGSSRRSAALFRPAGFGWGRARECGTRQLAASPTPPPIRARATPSLTRVVQIRLTADFQRRLSVRAFPDHFSGSFRRFGG